MLSLYSNYDSSGKTDGKINGGLNGLQEFRAQAQRMTDEEGLLISLISSTTGTLYIEYTNIVGEPYDFQETKDTEINTSTSPYVFFSIKKAPYFRIRFKNTSSSKQDYFKLDTFLIKGANQRIYG